MGIARKYILDCSETFASGVTTVTRISKYDLRDSFSAVRDIDGIVFEYYNIQLNDISDMTDQVYDQRVSDFFAFIGVRTLTERATLLVQASITDPNCI